MLLTSVKVACGLSVQMILRLRCEGILACALIDWPRLLVGKSCIVSEGLSVTSLTSHTLNSTAPDVLHHRHAEKGSGAYAILDLCPFQDSVVTNQKSVRLNHGARTQEKC